MLNKKEKIILDYLLKHQGQYCSSKQIARNLNYSDRTIRSYIKSLTTSIDSRCAQFIGKQGKGYQIVIKNKTLFNSLLQKEKNSQRIENPIDRQDVILKKLLFEGRHILFDNLVDDLFVSHSTLSSDFKKISLLITPYDLVIKSRPNYGVYLCGNEKNIRLFVIDYFLDNDLQSTIVNYIGNSLFDGNINFETVSNLLRAACKKRQMKLPDYTYQQLALHILISVNRVKNGFVIQSSSQKIRGANINDSFSIIDHVVTQLVPKIRLPIAEVDYIASCISPRIIQLSQQALGEEIKTQLLKIENQLTSYQFVDKTLIDAMEKHITPLIKRLENNIHLGNPFCDSIIEEYPIIFDICKSCFSSLSAFQTYRVSDDEYAYLTLHILAAIEKNKKHSKLHAVIVCTTGYSSAMMIKHRIESEFSEQLHISDIKGYYDLDDSVISDNDFIISSIDLSNIVFKIPCIETSIFLREDECQKIKKLIQQLRAKRAPKANLSSVESKQILDRKALVQHFFKASHCIFSTSLDKQTIIEHLLEKMAEGESPKYIRRMTALMAQRESLSSVVFSDAIAVPHPAKPVGNMAKVGLVTVPKGLYWSEKYQKIRFIFLISPSSYENAELKRITQAIIKLTEDKEMQNRLLKIKDFDHFIDYFYHLI